MHVLVSDVRRCLCAVDGVRRCLRRAVRVSVGDLCPTVRVSVDAFVCHCFCPTARVPDGVCVRRYMYV